MIIENGSTPRVIVYMGDASDVKTEETGLTVAVKVSKNGGAFATASDSPATEIGDGWYYLVLTATETETDGPLIVEASGTGAADYREVHQVTTTAAATLATATLNQIADHVIRRDFENVCDSSDGDTKQHRSLAGVISAQMGPTSLSGTTQTLYEDDGATTLGTITLTTGGGPSQPVTGKS